MKRVLVAPLDWGLGHATRCIPVINELVAQGYEVQVATSGDALTLLKQEVPTFKFHSITSYQVTYSSTLPLMLKIFLQVPKFLRVIKKEHEEIHDIIVAEKIDLVISDNRYGAWAETIPSVFITHQINFVLPGPCKLLQGFINYLNRRRVRKFTECWVPDFPGGITDKMTTSSNVKIKFIGMLSRFVKQEQPVKYDVLALISGPEPQRSIFEDKARSQLGATSLNYFVVRGKPGSKESCHSWEADHLPSRELNEVIESSRVILCRSGYSTVMDLWQLGKKAIFVPTPGQPEQEYLAAQLKKTRTAFCVPQDKLNISDALFQSQSYSGFKSPTGKNLIANAIKRILHENH